MSGVGTSVETTGTSVAAGEFSGIMALLLERNHKLTLGASHMPEPKLWWMAIGLKMDRPGPAALISRSLTGESSLSAPTIQSRIPTLQRSRFREAYRGAQIPRKREWD
jgi:hypothetical protein